MTTQEKSKPLKTVLMKQMLSDRRDCRITWGVDFASMDLLVHVDFISPALLIQFLARLSHDDERFHKTGIIDVVQICHRFTVKVYVSHGEKEVCYRLKAYRPDMPGYSRADIEIELTAYRDEG